MVTPFLKPLNIEGGTLYVFPSVSMDLTRTFVSNDYEFKFSHFACLNIPDIYSGTYTEDCDKGLYLETFGYNVESWTTDYTDDSTAGKGMDSAIAEHLQNYVMNFETAILNGMGDNDGYDNTIYTTVSEKVFFNWLQKVGAINFNDNVELYQTLEERTVQYIGDIEVVNTVEVNGDSFEELYIHIPSTVGASTSIKFRDGISTDTKNYLDTDYELSGKISETCIIGRDGVDHPYGLSTNPLMDVDDGKNVYMGDSGHTIDFRDSSYADGEGISTMNSESSTDFEFNAILIYYDFCTKDASNNTKTSYTNLYGILFLDNVTDLKGGNDGTDNTDTPYKQGYIQRYPKKKETTYGDGNSFALKVDLKIDTTPDYTSTVTTYQDPNNVVSMSLYQKAIVQLQKCIDFFYTQKNELISLEQRVSNLETMVTGIDTIETLRGEIDRLYNLYDGIGTTDALQSLIELNSSKLDSIINGSTNVKLQYDMDVLQSGTNITLDKSTNNVTINADQKYSLNTIYSDPLMDTVIDSDNPVDSGTTGTKSCYIPLRKGENFAVLSIKDGGDFTDSIYVYIDDDEISWVAGQSVKIYLDYTTLNFSSSSDGIVININDKTKTFTGDDISGKNLIEIIYIGTNSSDEDQYIYLIK